MDAGRTALIAFTVFDVVQGPFQEFHDHVKAALGKTDPARIAVVDKDGPFFYLGMVCMGDTTDVISVA